MIRIKLDNPNSTLYGELEQGIEQQLGLKEILIADEMELESKANHMQRVYEETLAYLAHVSHNRGYIEVSVGKTLCHLVNGEINVEKIDCTFVPVVGSVGTQLQLDEGHHSNEMASTFAKRLHGSAVQFSAPAMFSDTRIMEGFLKERSVQEVVALFKKLKIAIMSIGSYNLRDSTLVKRGYISKADYEQLKQHGTVRDALLKFLDKNGNSEPFHEFNDRVMGLSDGGLVNIRNCIGITAGEEKSKAVLGVIHAKKINILITNTSCVKEPLSLMEEEELLC